MENNINRLFNKEFYKRILSVFFIIPLMIIPILYNQYLLFLVYLIINSLVIYEIDNMKNEKTTLIQTTFVSVFVTFSFFIFIILLITDSTSTYKILEIIITIWLFDTFSFLGGKLIGKKKLMPTISAGKTVNGLIIGVLLTILCIQFYKSFIDMNSLNSILFTLFIILFSFIGDTCVSILKRQSSIKDSGNLIPGHGGLFDRFDSFISVFAIYGLYKILL